MSTFCDKVDHLCVFGPLIHLGKLYWESTTLDMASDPKGSKTYKIQLSLYSGGHCIQLSLYSGGHQNKQER